MQNKILQKVTYHDKPLGRYLMYYGQCIHPQYSCVNTALNTLTQLIAALLLGLKRPALKIMHMHLSELPTPTAVTITASSFKRYKWKDLILLLIGFRKISLKSFCINIIQCCRDMPHPLHRWGWPRTGVPGSWGPPLLSHPPPHHGATNTDPSLL